MNTFWPLFPFYAPDERLRNENFERVKVKKKYLKNSAIC